jgi:thioredoxin-related protein
MNLISRMIRISLLLVLYLSASFVRAAEVLPAYSREYDAARDPFVDGRAALLLARQTGRQVLIEVGGNWCSWCHQLDRFLAENIQVWDKLNRHFVVLKINVSQENENADFMAGLPRPLGYPHIFISDPQGHIIYSKDTAELVKNGKYSKQQFIKFIDRWKLP